MIHRCTFQLQVFLLQFNPQFQPASLPPSPGEVCPSGLVNTKEVTLSCHIHHALFSLTVVNILIVQVTQPPGLGSSSVWVSLCPHLLAISTPCQLFTPMIKDAISLLLPCKQNPHLHNCKTLLSGCFTFLPFARYQKILGKVISPGVTSGMSPCKPFLCLFFLTTISCCFNSPSPETGFMVVLLETLVGRVTSPRLSGNSLSYWDLKAVTCLGKELHSPHLSLQIPHLPTFSSFSLGTISQVIW